MLKTLWKDEAGALIAAEFILVATILVIGILVGLTAVRDAVVTELADVAQAIANVNQTYAYSGSSGHNGASTAGSAFADLADVCDGADEVGTNSKCVSVATGATGEGAVAPPAPTP